MFGFRPLIRGSIPGESRSACSLLAVQRIFEGATVPSLPDGSVVTVGTFDGVHIGHARLLHELPRPAAELQCPSVVVTLDRHLATFHGAFRDPWEPEVVLWTKGGDDPKVPEGRQVDDLLAAE